MSKYCVLALYSRCQFEKTSTYSVLCRMSLSNLVIPSCACLFFISDNKKISRRFFRIFRPHFALQQRQGRNGRTSKWCARNEGAFKSGQIKNNHGHPETVILDVADEKRLVCTAHDFTRHDKRNNYIFHQLLATANHYVQRMHVVIQFINIIMKGSSDDACSRLKDVFILFLVINFDVNSHQQLD